MRLVYAAAAIAVSAGPVIGQERFTSLDDASAWLNARVPSSQGWALVSASDLHLMSINYDTVKVGDFPIVQVWMRDDLTSPTDFAGEPYQSTKVLLRIHCFDDKYQTLANIFHPLIGGAGTPIFSTQEPTEWAYLIPDTTLKGATDWTCRYAQRLLDDPAGTLIDPLAEQ